MLIPTLYLCSAVALVVTGIKAWREASEADRREAALDEVNAHYDEQLTTQRY
jgi:hypothetical protein